MNTEGSEHRVDVVAAEGTSLSRGAPLKLCRTCGEYKNTEDFYTFKDGAHRACKSCGKIRAHQWNIKNRERRREHTTAYYRRLREAILDAYGRRCVCCGEDTSEFLGLDHVNNDGAEHRKEFGRGGVGVYLDVKRRGFPSEFQLLCHNCNLSKGMYGRCPHQIERKVAV